MKYLKSLNAAFGILFLLLATLFTACQSPTVNKPATAGRSLTVNWHVSTGARTIIPDSYPTPASYEVHLEHWDLAQTTIIDEGTTTVNNATTWSVPVTGAYKYTISVTGYDQPKTSGGRLLVAGAVSVDLTTTTAQTATIQLYYTVSGGGTETGTVNLTFNAPSVSDRAEGTLVLIGGNGVTKTTLTTVVDGWNYTNSSLPVGSYRLAAQLKTATKTATVLDTVLVVGNVETNATINLGTSDFQTTPVAVTALSFSPSTLTMVPSEVATLAPTITPTDATNPLVIWSTDSGDSATIDQNGQVTALALGTTVFRATSVEDSTYTDICTVTVSKGVLGSTTIVDPASYNYSVSIEGPKTIFLETFSPKFHVTYTGSGVDTSYGWYLDGTPCGEGQDLTFVPTTYGSHVLTVIAYDINGFQYSASLPVLVLNLGTQVFDLTPVVGELVPLGTALLPGDDASYTWRSDNPAVATVSTTGDVTALAVGTAHITANSVSAGRQDYATVTVLAHPYAVGDTGPGGGIIFYDGGNYTQGWRYLEVAPTDQSSYTGYTGGVLVTTYTAVGSGKVNTSALLSSDDGAEIAAVQTCTEYSGGGYSDWFLPSRGELNTLYGALAIHGVGGFSSVPYLSSYQYQNGTTGSGWAVSLSTGEYITCTDNTSYHSRAIREF